MKCNKLIINLGKNETEAMLFVTAKCLQLNPKQLELYYDQTKINITETYTYLGSTLESHLNLSKNFNKKCKEKSSKLRLLHNISHLLPKKAVPLTDNAVILPVIKFNCMIYMKLTMGQDKKLSSLDDHAWLVTKSNTNSIKGIMEKHTVLFVQKCLYGNTCNTFNISNLIIATSVQEIMTCYLSSLESNFRWPRPVSLMRVKYNLLLLEIQKSQLDFRDKMNNYYKNK